MSRKTAGPARTEDEYTALADSFERGEFSPVGDVRIAPDAAARLATRDTDRSGLSRN